MHAAHAPITVDRLRRLTIDPSAHPRGQPHLSAASGLVCAHGRAHVIGDDEHHLAVFRDRASAGKLHRIVAGKLPREKGARKRRKPDFESLLWLPGEAALLAVGSGSRPRRERAALIALRADGTPRVPAELVDLAPLYDPLRARLGSVNIEGAFVLGDELVLLNRGDADVGNQAAHYRLGGFIKLIEGRRKTIEPVRIQPYALGTIGGVALGFTDGAALPGGGWVFSAVAEDRSDSVTDGAFCGAAVGIVAADGRLRSLRRLASRDKIEGIDVLAQPEGLALFMVTDADDAAQAAWLLSARL